MKDKRLYHSVARQITELIGTGVYPPGSRLPAERELAETFEVSRVTIREAEIALQATGRIRIEPGSGVYVLDPAENHGDNLPEVSAFELTEARLLFESEAAALAADNICEETLVRLDGFIEKMTDSAAGEAEAELADRDFHLTIASASGNAAVRHVVESLWQMRTELEPVKQVYDSVCSEDSTARGEEHSEILDALRARDPAAARLAMRDHFRRLLESMLDVTEERAMAELRERSTASRQRFLKSVSI